MPLQKSFQQDVRSGFRMFGSPILPDGVAVAKKYMCSAAFCFLVCDALRKGNGMTAVRAGDGERAIIQASLNTNGANLSFGALWLKRYGVLDYPIDKLGKEIIIAGNDATWFGPNIAGLWMERYSLHSFFNIRQYYICALFSHMWAYCGYVQDVLLMGKVFVACRDNQKKIDDMTKRYQLMKGRLVGVELDSYHDHEAVCEAARSSDAGLVVISGGPVGKSLIGKIAEGNNKVVLDCGNGLVSRW